MTIHWCGTGLSAVPGLRRLLQEGHPVKVWNRTISKATEEIGDLTQNIAAFDIGALESELKAGDFVVSMLPADMHVPLAKLCLSAGAHFVSSSYIAPEMRALDEDAKAKGLCFVNEVGLDPGIDHLMAHELVADYRSSAACDVENELSFISYCGGVPKIPNPFRYKFSWSPFGVLKALSSPSKSLKDFAELNVARPWDAISSYEAPLPEAESFEVYPNRDSLPFIQDYRFDPTWKLRDFVRGTLRLNGWKDAWTPVFREIETLSGPEGDARMREMSAQFWKDNAYEEGEPDRVIMCVALKAVRAGETVWHKTYVMDAWGDERGTAMSRLVSVPVSLAVEAALAGKLPVGVTPAPHDPELVKTWLKEVAGLAQHLELVDHVTT